MRNPLNLNDYLISDGSNTVLNLKNKIRDIQDIKDVCLYLKKHPEIKAADLSNNYLTIGDTGAKILARNTTLRSLSLSNCDIHEAGALALSENETLTELDLGYNQVGRNGACDLARNMTLKSLRLYANNIGDDALQLFGLNKTLEHLDLKSTIVHDENIHLLCKNTTLRRLELRNKITDLGAIELLKMLYNNPRCIVITDNTNISPALIAILDSPTSLAVYQALKKLGVFIEQSFLKKI